MAFYPKTSAIYNANEAQFFVQKPNLTVKNRLFTLKIGPTFDGMKYIVYHGNVVYRKE